MKRGSQKQARQEREINDAILTGKSVVIDNTNVSCEERAQLIRQAHFLKANVVGYFFKSNVRDCIQRNNARTGRKPSGNDAKVPQHVIQSFARRMERPTLGEGFDKLVHVAISNQDRGPLEFMFDQAPMRAPKEKLAGIASHPNSTAPVTKQMISDLFAPDLFGKRKRGSGENVATNNSLDSQARNKRTRIKDNATTDFHCFRCNQPKRSKSMYKWSTSEGAKIVCNGCHGFLCSPAAKPKV